MTTRNLFRSLGTALLLATAVSACASDADTQDGNSELGIARFSVTEAADLTVVSGLDASGIEVARLELVHGSVTVWPEYTEQFEGAVPDGRSVNVIVEDQRYRWETLGYAPVMSLPAIPSRFAKLGLFLEDPHVVEVLSRWQVGFEAFDAGAALGDESPYETTYLTDHSGTGGTGCTNCTALGTVQGTKTINLCNGHTATHAGKVYVGGTYSQWFLDQRCHTYDVGVPYDVWALLEKTCSETGNTSQCGTTTGACAGCGTIATANPGGDNNDVGVWWSSTRLIGSYTQNYPIP